MVKRCNAVVIWGIALVLGLSLNARAEVVDRIVALVNDEIITLRELNDAAQPYVEKVMASQKTDEQKKKITDQIRSEILSKLIDGSLTKQAAVTYGIVVDDTDVDMAIDNFKKAHNLDDEGLEKGLASEGLTLETYRARMKDQILQSRLLTRAVRSKIIVTDEDVKAYYEAHAEQFAGTRKYHLRNILTLTEDKIKEVVAKLKQNEDFSALAKTYSVGSNASEGGDLGIFDIDSVSHEIKDAIAGLGKGEYTGIVKTGTAYQILYVDDIVTEGNLSLEAAGDKIREILYRTQGEKQFKDWIKKLKQNAHIKLML